MNTRWMTTWRGARHVLAGLVAGFALAACGGGGGGTTPDNGGNVTPVDPNLADGNSTTLRQVLTPVPSGGSSGGGSTGTSTTLTVHYHRLAADYGGWVLHTWGAAQETAWATGLAPSSTDTFGDVFQVPLAQTSGAVGYIIHNGDTKDDGGADQSYTLQDGANEIWRVEGDLNTYTTNPYASGTPDINTVRVHYIRYANDYSSWGLHLWGGNGLDTAAMGSIAYGDWNNPTPFSAMPGYTLGATQVTFDIPVLNPATNTGQSSLQFIIHGISNVNDKDGWDNNITVNYAALSISGQVGEIWVVQGKQTVYTSVPDTRSVSTTDARAYWLTSRVIKWPLVSSGSTVKLYWSATGQVVANKGTAVSGADGAITLDDYSGSIPGAVATRFKFLDAGSAYTVRDADVASLPTLHKNQLVLVQEDIGGNVQNATTAQVAGALDDLYASASSATLGATVAAGSTTYRLWAPTAQSVMLYRYAGGTTDATNADVMTFDAATGIWSATIASDTSGSYYRFGVKVFVRGVGVVRNLVTDPYSLSLAADSARSQVINLDAAAAKPAGWDASTPPATVAGATDMSIYELHVRDFSANDATVPSAHRGKYLAFTDTQSNGMLHLKALADAGLTDVHLMPMFDFSSVPETGCTTPSPTGTADGESQQAAVVASASTDCFNWGYDPYHYTAPEGSYATSVADGTTRVVEFRSMVQALNAAGLRVGMDVVFNHTTSAGQNDHSVLDEIVPGYYYRLSTTGNVTTESCCQDTATENAMMAKLMADSVVTWARDYHVSSFRFDIMGLLTHDSMVAVQAKVDAAVGHHVELLGEGWNIAGVTQNGARFVQADMFDMNDTLIGSFNPIIRDAVRGGSPFDSGTALVSNQGFINGMAYDPNSAAGSHTAGDLGWLGDLVRASMAGSIRSYSLTTSWGAQLPLEQITLGGSPVGFVTQPAQAVNYVENHDNQTLFDNNTYKLPLSTSLEDRARVQMLGAAIDMFSQGVAYFHAGVDTLRSKSMDKNSYDSGDWFNKLDWSYADNNFGVGAPPKPANEGDYDVLKPLLANGALKPTATQIQWTRDQFRDLLRIRKSSSLLRIASADDIKARLKFYNTLSTQEPTVIVGDLDGTGYTGANFQELTYFINVDKQAHQIAIPALAGRAFVLHPVHAATGAVDTRAAQATYDGTTGTFAIPARTAVVFVVQ
jgi:pullulanase